MASDRPEVHCRTAIADDWPAIWAIFAPVAATGETYTYPPDITEEDARDGWLKLGHDRAATYVAELPSHADGAPQVVATAVLVPNQPGLGDHVANAGWMVAPSAVGRGVGRALAHYVLGEARRLGYTAMQFNAVVETNTRAVALWQSLGFEIVGTVPGAFRHHNHGDVGLHIMHRRL